MNHKLQDNLEIISNNIDQYF